MSETSSQANKRRIAALSLTTLSIIDGEDGQSTYQLIIAPSSAEFPKRTITFDQPDASQLAIELELVARLLRHDSVRR